MGAGPKTPNTPETPKTPGTPKTRGTPNPLLRLALETGPLVVFFVVLNRTDIVTATPPFMIAILVSLGISIYLERRVPIMPLVTAIFVTVFGGLTVLLDSGLFIKIKPTIINSFFAVALLVGLAFKRSLLKVVLGETIPLQEEGWRILTKRWAFFFAFLAVLNEVIWRNFSEEFWAGFKLFGMMPLTVLFTASQMPLLNRYSAEEEDEQAGEGGEPAPPGA